MRRFSIILSVFAIPAAIILYFLANTPVDRVPGTVPPPNTLANKGKGEAWPKVWSALQQESVPAPAKEEGPPVRIGDRVLFRFQGPPDGKKVYLAGSFNGFAQNHSGHISSERFAMRPLPDGKWYQWESLGPGDYTYKYVVETADGSQTWIADPRGERTDHDGNTVLRLTATESSPATEEAHPTLKAFTPGLESTVANSLDVQPEKVWVQPGDTNTLVITPAKADGDPERQLELTVETPFGEVVHTASASFQSGDNHVAVPALDRQGGFLARLTLSRSGKVIGRGEAVLSVVRNVADDLRYGFFASYPETTGNYRAKAMMLARLHLNALEFYDYFPAHGSYAPREKQYRFEPFGTAINAVDIQQKIAADRNRNILSLAYIAAYAASESVYRKYPYPMTDEKGVPKIFNGDIMSEDKADREKRPKWFWLMNVAGDSPWHNYIMGELRRALGPDPRDLVSFDGFEIDTYGDSPDTRFYAKDSKRNGDLLRDVLHDFVGDVRKLTHEVKPYGLVSFNSVNEFAIEQMYDVTDFLFLEIWRGHTDQLGGLIDICRQNRAPRNQRVILKLYPADMSPAQKVWPATTLRRVLGAAMTGGGSLMVAGEPDEKKGQMHALSTLYYPDHQPLPTESEAILRAYYRHDAMLLGYTHGRDVFNTDVQLSVPGCITRTYAAPENHALVVQLLRIGDDGRWSADVPAPKSLVNQEVALELPGGIAPKSVFYASPDVPFLQNPVPLDFEVTNGTLRTMLPELQVHGTLVLRYE